MVTTKAEYYIRLLLLNVQVATPALCETFISFVGKTTRKSVDDFLKVFEKGFKSLEKKRIIKKAEFTKLFPSSGKTLIREWDISLLCVVLFHCCTLNDKLYELRDMLLKEAQRNVNNYVQTHRTAINSMKGAEIDDDEYETVFPIDNSDTKYEKWNIHLIMQILIKLCPAKKTNVMEILRAIFIQEVGLKCSNLDINEFLNCYKDKFLDLNKKSKLSKAQFDTLFPVKGADINTWDDHTLEVVLLNTTSTLSKKTISYLRKLRTIRSDFLAHRGNAEIKFTKFSEKRYELTKAVTKILEENKLPTLEIKQKINDIVDDPLEIKSSIDCLKAYYTKESLENDNILEALDTVCNAVDSIGLKVDAGFGKMDSRLDAFLEHLDNIERKLPDSAYTEKAEIRCVDMIFVIKSDTVEKKEKAESLIMTAMHKAQQNTTEQIRAAFDVIRKIITEDGKVIVEIKHGSVIVVIKCISLKGFHRLLKYVQSDQIQTHLAVAASALEDFTGKNTEITVSVSYDSLVNASEDIVSHLTDYIDHTSHLKMTIERSNVQDLHNLVREFQVGEGAAQLRILSSNLSDYLGENIRVDAVTPKYSLMDQQQFKGTSENPDGTNISTLSQFQLSEKKLQLPGTSDNLEDINIATLSMLELPDNQLQLPGDQLETTDNPERTNIAAFNQFDLSESKLQLPGTSDNPDGTNISTLSQFQLSENKLQLSGNPPCSVDGTFHYSWDYAQQVHYPYHIHKVGPISLTPRKCNVFGICSEGSVFLEILMKNKKLLLKDIRKYKKYKNYKKPHCLLMSLTGQGKSALINTLKSIFVGEYCEVAKHGKGNTPLKSLELQKYSNYGIIGDDYLYSDVDGNITELIVYLATLFDFAGFGNANNLENREIMELLIAGRIPVETTIGALQDFQEEHGAGWLATRFKNADPDMKIDKIIFLHACNEAVPAGLIECLNAVLAKKDKQTCRFKYNVDVVAVITKIDLVMERSDMEGETIPKEIMDDDRQPNTISMLQYIKLEGDLARLLNIEGALENNLFQWKSFCEDVGYDTTDPRIANNVYKLTRRLVSPSVENGDKPGPIIDWPTYIKLSFYKVVMSLRNLGQEDFVLSGKTCMTCIAIVVVLLAIFWYMCLK